MTSTSPRESMPLAQSAPLLVGRGREQATLRACLEAAVAGRGGLVLVGGEAGIGKTTLVDGLAAEARHRGVIVRQGHCYDLTQAPPYGPWRDALAAEQGAAPEVNGSHPFQIDAAHGEIASQARLFADVRAHLAGIAAQQPVLLVLEDLHWSDPASLELLRVLGRDVQSLAILLVATYRVDELTRRHPLFQLLPHLARESRAERIDLSGLDARETRGLVSGQYTLSARDLARLADYLQARAGGNPLYLSEVLRALEAGGHLQATPAGWALGALDAVSVPPLIEQIIESRLARLAAETLHLLEIAAVIGQEVPLDLLQQLSALDDDHLARALDEAAAAHVLREEPGGRQMQFAHALVRDALYLRQPAFGRRAAHRRVAELLAGRVDPPLSVIASHFASADDPRAIGWLVRAGEQALTLYAARDAAAALTRAHELAARHGQALPAPAYRARARAHALLGEFDGARRDHELVLERARAEGDRQAEWQALVDLGMLWAERDYDRTGTYVRAALDLARAVGDELMIARGLNGLANWHVNLDEADLALPIHEQALAIFESVADRAGIADTLGLLAMASYLSCCLPQSTDYGERAISLLRELNDRPHLASCLSTLALSGGYLDILARPAYRESSYWRRRAEEGLATAREIGWQAGEAYAHFTLSLTNNGHGQFDQALHHADLALSRARQVDHLQWTVAAHFGYAAIWTELLALDRAGAALETALTAARASGSRFWTYLLAGTLASNLIAAGDVGRAAALLGSMPRPAQLRRSLGQRQLLLAEGQLALAQDDANRALAIIDQLNDAAPQLPEGQGIPSLLKLRGDALVQLDRRDEAERAYLAAHAGATLYGYQPLLWKIDAVRAHLLGAAGRAAEAAAAAARARVVIAELAGSIPDDALRGQFSARALARLPGAAFADGEPPPPTLLSPRELDVLRLIVEGCSDREIASALSISPRTVMRHVTGILTKLDVPSRTAAATLAMRQQLV